MNGADSEADKFMKVFFVELGDFNLFLGLPENGARAAFHDVFDQLQLEKGNENVLFVPYQRAGLVYVYELANELLNKLPDDYIKNYMLHYANAKEKIRRNEVKDTFILDVISVFADANVKVIGEWLKFEENNALFDPEIYPAMVNEVTDMLLPLIDLETPAWVLIEQPEAHVHPAYQTLLLLAFLSLVQHGYKFVIYTDSDLMASFLGDLVRYKPNKEKIAEVMKKILKLNSLPPTIEKIIEETEKTVRKIVTEGKINVYYFKNGIATEYPAKELVFNVPGITKQVIDSIVLWETEMIGDD